jgi:hypothetical protein
MASSQDTMRPKDEPGAEGNPNMKTINVKIVERLCTNGHVKVFKDHKGHIGGYVGRNPPNYITFVDARGRNLGSFRASGEVSDEGLIDLPKEILELKTKYPIEKMIQCDKMERH